MSGKRVMVRKIAMNISMCVHKGSKEQSTSTGGGHMAAIMVLRKGDVTTCRDATEMSAASTATPAGSVKRLMIGSRAYVASAGASSVIVYRILSLAAAVELMARVEHVAAATAADCGAPARAAVAAVASI